jgi:hypothetical protein
MTHESLVNQDWNGVVARLGGAAMLNVTARERKAFLRPREITNAVDLLRLILAYCLGERGLRLTAAWATSVGLVDISSVALLYRLRQCGDWLAMLVGQALVAAAPKASRGRLIRIIDATTVPKAGPAARKKSELWRIHSAFDLPHERFGHFELTDQQAGETLDRIPVVKGEIRLADRAYLQPDRMAAVIEAGADFVIRAGWKSACWLDAEGRPLDLIAELRKASARGLKQGLAAADWVIMVTSLTTAEFETADVLALYRLRWRIELGFKRLKSLIGLKGPPGADERSARPYVLAHLLIILLLEPLVDELEDSPRLAEAA